MTHSMRLLEMVLICLMGSAFLTPSQASAASPTPEQKPVCDFVWGTAYGKPLHWKVSNYDRKHYVNRFRCENVELKADGIHLKLERRNGVWFSAEVMTEEVLGFGEYTFKVVGPIDRLDQNIIFGIFSYLGAEYDGTNEIDIEFARWGDAKKPEGNYTIWPGTQPTPQNPLSETFTFDFELNGEAPYYTTHRYIWREDSVTFSSYHGHDEKYPLCSACKGKVFQASESFPSLIPQRPLHMLFNLWLFHGSVPSQAIPGDKVEVVITGFTFEPLQPAQVN